MRIRGFVMEWHFSAVDSNAARAARRSFVDFLQSSCTAESDFESAEIVYGELVANAIGHAAGPIDIHAQADAHGLVRLDVCDTGKAFDLEATLPPPESECGRGLYIVSKLCPSLAATGTASGKTVSAVLPVRALALAPE